MASIISSPQPCPSRMSSNSCLRSTGSSSSSGSEFLAPNKNKKSIRFLNLEVIEFPNELGDNPSVEFGPPITIGNEPLRRESFDLDQYEYDIAQQQQRRRSTRELSLSRAERSMILLDAGYTLQEIIAAGNEANAIQKRRVASMKSKKWDQLQEAVEGTRKCVKNVFRR